MINIPLYYNRVIISIIVTLCWVANCASVCAQNSLTSECVERVLLQYLKDYKEYPLEKENITDFIDDEMLFSIPNSDCYDCFQVFKRMHEEDRLGIIVEDSLFSITCDGLPISTHNMYIDRWNTIAKRWLYFAEVNYCNSYYTLPFSMNDIIAHLQAILEKQKGTTWGEDNYWAQKTIREFSTNNYTWNNIGDTIMIYHKGTLYDQFYYYDWCADSEILVRKDFYQYNFYDNDGFWEPNVEDDFKNYLTPYIEKWRRNRKERGFYKRLYTILKYDNGSLSPLCPNEYQYYDYESLREIESAIAAFLKEKELLPKAYFPFLLLYNGD